MTGTFTEYFAAFGPQVATFIGCGGKTSSIWALAERFRARRTLVATTTHMARPPAAENRYDYFFDRDGLPDCARSGVALAGDARGGRLASLEPGALERLIGLYEYVFIEGDGSRMKPLKAWEDWEPVVAESTTLTVGVLPLWPLGRPIDEALVHRLPLFLSLVGAEEGQRLEVGHLAALIAGSGAHGGLFKAARGKKILFFNQVEDEAAEACALELVDLLPCDLKKTLHGVIAGSVQRNRVRSIFPL
ncbi:MAG: putative selenium-dependent hydroxylase accessory protein YqeC [Spirochaetaceae bacterium]|jgi:probable selenium-dependent hydroxylase accessory protein YqeC|nr:putative selenium-dependent hydroxylase accessory protein YqeC [Spirochaetaceae bacterium]